MFFSVIIPTFNRARFVTKAVDSVLRQTFPDYEIIVVDDGSTDSTAEVLRGYGDRIKVVQQFNAGVSSARNRGIEVATGEWLAFLDSDDEWKPQYLISQMEVIRSYPQVLCVIANALNIEEGIAVHPHFQQNLLKLFGETPVIEVARPFVNVITHSHWYLQPLVGRRNVFLRSGLFNPTLSIAEDLDVIARLALEGPFALNRDILVEIHRRSESTPSLASQREQDGLRASGQFQKVLDNLSNDRRLTRSERKQLARVRSANERWRGNLSLAAGEIARAREHYRKALTIHPSARALGKCALSLLPRRVMLSVNKSRRGRGW